MVRNDRFDEVSGIGGWRAHRTVAAKEILRPNGRTAYEAICDARHSTFIFVAGRRILTRRPRVWAGATAGRYRWGALEEP